MGCLPFSGQGIGLPDFEI